MSDAASAIFVPSRSSSLTNEHAGSTPYVVSSPPPDSPTKSEAAWPHQQMIEHVARLLNVAEDEVQKQFPTNRSLLPIDCSPPRASSPIFVPPAPSPPFIPGSPIGPYPGSEFEGYVDPVYPNSPPRLPLADITPIHQVTTPTSNTTDYEEMAMVLYCQVSDQQEQIAILEADKENRVPTLEEPQPGVHPGSGWQDNFDEKGTRHFFVIPCADEDVIAPFIHYDLCNPFPELLATNGRNCTVHSCPLHAAPQTSRASPLSPRNKLFFHPNLELTSGVDWAILWEDDATLAGEVQHF